MCSQAFFIVRNGNSIQLCEELGISYNIWELASPLKLNFNLKVGFITSGSGFYLKLGTHSDSLVIYFIQL
jgi:hypothetical protein